MDLKGNIKKRVAKFSLNAQCKKNYIVCILRNCIFYRKIQVSVLVIAGEILKFFINFLKVIGFLVFCRLNLMNKVRGFGNNSFSKASMVSGSYSRLVHYCLTEMLFLSLQCVNIHLLGCVKSEMNKVQYICLFFSSLLWLYFFLQY